MKRTMRFMIILGLALGTSLSACNLDQPACTADEMPAPLQGGPGDWNYSRLTEAEEYNPPTFTWAYPGTCMPDEYRVIISRATSMPSNPFFEYMDLVVLDTRTTGVAGPTIVYDEDTTAIAVNFTPAIAFETGTYYWRVIPYSGIIPGEYSDWKPFRIGPMCYDVEHYLLPARLIYPAYGATVPAGYIDFTWLDDNPCVLAGTFQVELSEFTTFPEEATTILPREGGTLWTEAQGHLNFCRRYYWRVSILLAGDVGELVYGPTSEVSMFNTSNWDGSVCEEPAPTPTSSAPTSMSYAPSGVFASPLGLVNCRSGPALDYPILSILPAGEQFEIHGRNTDGDAWQVFDPEIGGACWVNADLVEVIGDSSLVEIVIPSPPPLIGPTDTPASIVDCSQYNGALWQSCNLDPACYWDPTGGTGNGECKNK